MWKPLEKTLRGLLGVMEGTTKVWDNLQDRQKKVEERKLDHLIQKEKGLKKKEKILKLERSIENRQKRMRKAGGFKEQDFDFFNIKWVVLVVSLTGMILLSA